MKKISIFITDFLNNIFKTKNAWNSDTEFVNKNSPVCVAEDLGKF